MNRFLVFAAAWTVINALPAIPFKPPPQTGALHRRDAPNVDTSYYIIAPDNSEIISVTLTQHAAEDCC